MSTFGPYKEGETPIPREGLRDATIVTREQLNAAEFRNIAQATYKYLAAKPSKKLAPFTLDWSLRLHREMFGDVWDWAGKVRTTELNIGIDPAFVTQELGGLFLNVEVWKVIPQTVLNDAVKMHFEAVRIHPFENGNGRWSRLLANIWLKQQGFEPVQWPEDVIIEGENAVRKEYLDAIRTADKGDLRPLVEMHRRFWPDE